MTSIMFVLLLCILTSFMFWKYILVCVVVCNGRVKLSLAGFKIYRSTHIE